MTKLWWVLALIVVAAVNGCGAGNATGRDDRLTQIGAGMEPAVKAGQVITIRAVGRDYSPRRGDIVVFRADGPKWGGDVFVMGDNRAKAVDSRCAATIPAASVFAVPA